MTLGEKLKDARKQASLSQEQLAEKLGVSRSAVAKWETDNGIPDVGNLKVIAQLLDVSIDYLLDDSEGMEVLVLREPYDLSAYGKGSKFTKKNRVVRDKFPDGEIYALLAEQKLTRGEKVVDNLLGILTDAPFGIPSLLNSIKNTDKQFYLVEQDGRQFFVTVTDESIESRQLAKRLAGKKFELGDWNFVKCEKPLN